MSYEQIREDLRHSYNRTASERDAGSKTAWKVAERQHFLDLLQAEGKTSLLEVGAGTGQDSRFFAEQGLDVVCTDLSEEMVQRCREKGLVAHRMDSLNLDFPAETFDAVYSLNCLLHVPKATLPAVLSSIRTLLRPGGLFFYGVYGGHDREGIWQDDHQEPKRFFSYFTDEALLAFVAPFFEVVSFRSLPLGDADRTVFQSLTLRRPGADKPSL